MANEQNLKPFTSDQSHEEAVRNGKKGGINSGKTRRRKKKMKDDLLTYLKTVGPNGLTMQENITQALINRALKGDTKAYEVIRDTIGQKPREELQLIQTPVIKDDIE